MCISWINKKSALISPYVTGYHGGDYFFFSEYFLFGSQNNVDGIKTRLRAERSTKFGSNLDRARNFCLLQNVQTGCEAHRALYSMSTKIFYTGGKAVGA